MVQDRNIYLSIPYLEALEKTMERDIDIFYAIVYNEAKEPLMIAVFQLVIFEYRKNDHPKAILKHFHNDANKEGCFSMYILVCGNVFSDGENGFLWNSKISEEDAMLQVVDITKRIKNDKNTRKKLSVILFKEFWPQSVSYSDILKEHKFKDFMIDVNMVLPIHASWKSMEDYLFSMKTKFRTKAKSVFKKSRSLEIKSLSYEEIITYKDRIQELFDNVLERSDYIFGTIEPMTFAAFKKNLGITFSIRGLFYENKLVGFSTAFFHRGIMEANYVGIDYAYNLEYGVYQRLLYDYVDQAITNGSKELQLGRTSELIKSSLGARPINMKLYAKHKMALTNMLMSTILGFVSPSKFELRKPFKANFPNL
ncbi:MAG: hypothetical protein ACR2MT_02910 [Aurantibacter sp.]